MTFSEDARALQGDLAELRHALHRIPEVGLDLPRTQATVLEALEGLDLEVTTGTGCTSVTAVLRGGADVPDAERRTVLLRGDMDALPVTEEVDVPFRSEHEGRMHACGHDLHTSMLVGAARLLHARRDELPGDVVLMFQPGEEGFDGAGVMIDEGVLDAAGRRPDGAWALHVFSASIPTGVVTGRGGPLMASSNELHVTVRGAGGHGSAPQMAKDPVPVAAEMVLGLQNLMTRTVSPFAPAVLTVGQFSAGTKANVIPDTAQFAATVRCFDDDVLARLEKDTVRYCQGVAAAHGVEVDARFVRQYPVTVNDATAVGFAERVVGETLGSDRWQTMDDPITGSEDFSRVLQAVPGAMLFLGAPAGGDHENAAYNHSPFAAYTDDVLADGAGLYADLAAATLAARSLG
ncbi:M20 metallopeptidase family protein [Thalassiella azotivora]